MSWASRRRAIYGTGVSLFFLVVIGGPIAYHILTIPPTCTDGKQNGGETGIDIGGPCPVLDPSALQQQAILWARAFKVRDGTYSAAAYVQNSNRDAGVMRARYRFGLYDANNILVAERGGVMFIMPGAITPVLEDRIDTGNRVVAHTNFCFADGYGNCDASGASLTWERMKNTALVIDINNKQLTNTDTMPRLSASAENTSVADVVGPSFVAVIFDPAGNAFAASATTLDRIRAGASSPIVFTWPDLFNIIAGRTDVTPMLPPVVIPAPGQ